LKIESLTPLKNDILNVATRSVVTGEPPPPGRSPVVPDHQLLRSKLSRELTIPTKVRSTMYPVPAHATIMHLWVYLFTVPQVTLMCARQRETDGVRAPLLFIQLARGPCVARNINMHLYELFILWETKMNEGMPYLQMWRGVRVSF
jgi:hypothetical protein